MTVADAPLVSLWMRQTLGMMCRAKLAACAQGEIELNRPLAIPAYLEKTYWWAYIHPRAVSFFERQWLVNLILWGNFSRLRDAALDELGQALPGRTLQVACVYGDFTAHLARRIAPGGQLDIVDVLPIQLRNLRSKLPESAPVELHHRDSTDLGFAAASYDQAIVFFLLHEQPEAVRRQTVSESLRVLKPGGRLVVVDYHQPGRGHPLRYLFRPILDRLEPFALDLWNHEISSWFPQGFSPRAVHKQTYYGGLYQKVVITV
jgi:ubiquinone/menaquinone biosynthesis C-methylase UbiE